MPCVVISPPARPWKPTTESAHTGAGSRDIVMCSHSGCSHSGPSCHALGTRHSSGHPTLPALSVMSRSSQQALPPGASPLGTSRETGKSEHYCSLCCVPILNPCLGVLSRCRQPVCGAHPGREAEFRPALWACRPLSLRSHPVLLPLSQGSHVARLLPLCSYREGAQSSTRWPLAVHAGP